MFVDLVFAHRYFKNHGANVSDLSFCDGPSGNSRQKLQEVETAGSSTSLDMVLEAKSSRMPDPLGH
jgi:hypothetical protein